MEIAKAKAIHVSHTDHALCQVCDLVLNEWRGTLQKTEGRSARAE
jgi:hypothetical protein